MSKKSHAAGFTLLEVMLVIAVIAALAALAVPAYQDYTERARAAEVLAKYDAVRTDVLTEINEVAVRDCGKITEAIDAANLVSDGARLSVHYQKVSSDPLQGYRPVFMVCARADRQGDFAVGIARAAHHEFTLTNTVEAGSIVLDSVVSFAVPLTSDGKAVCYVPQGAHLAACGDPVATPVAQAATAPQAPVITNPPAVAAPTAQAVLVPQQLAPMSESVTTDFSQPAVFGFTDPSVWGWKTDNPSGKVEYGKGSTYGDTSGGNAGIVELEGRANEPSNLYREIATQPGAKYVFSFDLSGRVGTTSQSAAVEIIWEGKVVDTLYPAGNTFGFVSHSYNLEATTAGSRIELRAVTQDGAGPIVDNLAMAYQGTN